MERGWPTSYAVKGLIVTSLIFVDVMNFVGIRVQHLGFQKEKRSGADGVQQVRSVLLQVIEHAGMNNQVEVVAKGPVRRVEIVLTRIQERLVLLQVLDMLQ